MCASFLFQIPGHVYFLSVSGTGNTQKAFILELIALVFYVSYITYIILYLRMDVAFCWTAEVVYGSCVFLFSYLYIRNGSWRKKRI
jgi:Na+-driven multidrug efflux pump